ncbi:MAG TPA: TRAP transporter substrate-binding protein DctP [Polyangia bacterium]|nr:TRAP transporter substrate-binding protein DctP [Polyangia bacterium]
MIRCATLLLLAASAHAEPITLRLATAAPDGTAWARQLKQTSDGVTAGTNGAIKIKWYWGGIAGDEIETGARMDKGQLDGVASGGPLCDRIMPSMRVLGLPGLFQSRDEAAYAMHSLRATLTEEAQKAGFALLITSGLGPTVVFSRNPIRSMAELRATKLWTWDLNEVEVQSEKAMGLQVNVQPLLSAARSYSTNVVDGFIAVPAAALAFQWSTQAHYLTDLRTRYLTACIVIPNRVFDKLPQAHQAVLREEFAKGDARFEDLGRRMDEELLGGLFGKQGMVSVPVSETFRSQFFESARQAREKLGGLVAQPLIARVLQMLVDYRAEHRTAAK